MHFRRLWYDLGDSRALLASLVRSRRLSCILSDSRTLSASLVHSRRLLCAFDNSCTPSTSLMWFSCALGDSRVFSSNLNWLKFFLRVIESFLWFDPGWRGKALPAKLQNCQLRHHTRLAGLTIVTVAEWWRKLWRSFKCCSKTLIDSHTCLAWASLQCEACYRFH